jgi:hypothetical protein
MVVPGFMRSFRVLIALLCLGEASPEEFNQFIFREEFGLCPSINFLHDPLQLAAVRDLPKLNYKCSSHDEIRIPSSRLYARENFVEFMCRRASGTGRVSERLFLSYV